MTSSVPIFYGHREPGLARFIARYLSHQGRTGHLLDVSDGAPCWMGQLLSVDPLPERVIVLIEAAEVSPEGIEELARSCQATSVHLVVMCLDPALAHRHHPELFLASQRGAGERLVIGWLGVPFTLQELRLSLEV